MVNHISNQKTYRVETNQFVVSVVVDHEDKIKHGAHLIRKFYGQPFENLTNWCKNKFNYTKVHVLDEETKKFVEI